MQAKIRRPMRAYSEKPEKRLDIEALRYPLFGSWKLDGFRAVIAGTSEKPDTLSKNMKPIRNAAVRRLFAAPNLLGHDGELIWGTRTGTGKFKETSSVVTTHDAPADGVRFFVFDSFVHPGDSYLERYEFLKRRAKSWPSNVILVKQVLLKTPAALRAMEQEAFDRGYEGLMLRDPYGLYKAGTSTLAEQYLVKFKRTQDSEGVILDVLPRMHNTNEQVTAEDGSAKRSKKKGGMVALPEVGKFVLRDIKTGVTFECAPGIYKREELQAMWKTRAKLKKKLMKYRFQPAGTDKKPRFPRALGLRDRGDM